MEYKVITDKIEVRSIEENNKPRYIVRGTAAIANKKHIYDFAKQKDGTFKTKSSMFTPHFLESIREQAKHRKLFIDTQHELARNASIKALVKDKFNAEEQKQLDNMLDRKMLPLAKINDIDIIGNNLDISTELNSAFREVDEEHKKYFDAVWYSLENKFLNGISINFTNFKYLKDSKGDLVIDDAEVLGFSYLDSPSDIGDSIYEVAIRAIEENTGETEMDEKEKQLEENKKKLDEEKAAFEKEKADAIKAKEDADVEVAKKAEEEKKTKDMEEQKAEQDKIKKELEEKTVEAKKLQEKATKAEDALNKAKGTVAQAPNPNAIKAGSETDPKFYQENIAKITAEHDHAMEVINKGQHPLVDSRMKGFSELINLQAQANDPTADLNAIDAAYIKEHKLLGKSDSDLNVGVNRS